MNTPQERTIVGWVCHFERFRITRAITHPHTSLPLSIKPYCLHCPNDTFTRFLWRIGTCCRLSGAVIWTLHQSGDATNVFIQARSNIDLLWKIVISSLVAGICSSVNSPVAKLLKITTVYVEFLSRHCFPLLNDSLSPLLIQQMCYLGSLRWVFALYDIISFHNVVKDLWKKRTAHQGRGNVNVTQSTWRQLYRWGSTVIWNLVECPSIYTFGP